MSEEENHSAPGGPPPPSLEGAAADETGSDGGAAAPPAEEAAYSESAYNNDGVDAHAAVNGGGGDVEMEDAAAAENGAAAATSSGSQPPQEAPRRTRSSSFDVRENGDADGDAADDNGAEEEEDDDDEEENEEAEEEEAPAKKPVMEATRVSARTASKAADREAGGGGGHDNAMSSLLDAAEIRTASVNPAGGTGMSFLDTLSEEERRTRLRHVPAADGFRGLQRSEVKRDLSLARSILTGAGGAAGTIIASSKASASGSSGSGSSASAANSNRAGRRSYDDAYMDIDDDDGGMSDDCSDADLGGPSSADGGPRRSDHHRRDLLPAVPTEPSPAFVPPADTDPLPGSLPTPADPSDPASSAQAQEKGPPRYPHIIESTVAFDPPRLPHSDAKNKKNRFARWQAHPKDMEKDLENYRKTVADTRELLRNSEKETERYEVIGGHLRGHFLDHLRVLRNEGVALERDLGEVQARCIERADLTKTRSTDTDGGIGPKAMHDVLTALKAKGVDGTGTGHGTAAPAAQPWCSVGVGGVPISSAAKDDDDGDDGTGNTSALLATGWILPGDSVETPMGEGVVVDVAAPKLVEIPDEDEVKAKAKAQEEAAAAKEEEAKKKKEAEESKDAKGDDAATDTSPPAHGFGAPPTSDDASAKKDDDTAADATADSKDKADDNKSTNETTGDAAKKDDEKAAEGEKDKLPKPPKKVELNLIFAQARVRLSSDGSVQSFGLSDLTLIEDPSSYSDEQLIERWKKMVATAKTVGCCANIDAMDSPADGPPSSRSPSLTSSGSGVENSMEVHTPSLQVTSSEDAKAKLDEYGLGYADLSKTKMSTNQVVPVASGMLLNPSLRGTSLAAIPFEKFEQYLDPMLFDGKGVLGRCDNPGVSSDVKQWEDVRYELVTLKGRANQLRNELHRQRRIRAFNERTRHVLDERAERVEGLLAEMKSDLVTLKERLEHELGELGMDQDHAAEILAAYIKDRNSAIENQEFIMPKKRAKADVKAVPPPRVSRRNKNNQGSDDNDDTGSMKGDDDDSTAAKRKRNRSDESSDSGAPKAKRGGNRRQ